MKRPITKRIISLTIITVMLITSMTVNLHAYVGEEEIIKTSEEAADELTDENSEAVSYTITDEAPDDVPPSEYSSAIVSASSIESHKTTNSFST